MKTEERCRLLVVMDVSDGGQSRNTVDVCTIHGIRARNTGMRTD